MTPKRILIIDDDQKLNQLVTDYLTQHSLEVQSAVLPSKGIKKLTEFQPDLVILDVMLPEMDGFEVCKQIRKSSAVPIIMLTARGEVLDRVLGLELGADDYLPKPFEPRELLARIHSILRRAQASASPDASTEVLHFAHGLTLNLRSQEAFLDQAPLLLTTTEFELLVLFARNPGKAMDRDEILGKLRGIEWEGFNRSVDMVVSRLRQKLNDPAKQPRFFKTVWGRGYLFLAEPVS